MKYKLNALGGLRKKLDIHLSSEQVQKSFDEHYKKKQQKVHLPGFRKGKVPLNQIRAMYQDAVKKDATVSLLNKFYLEALEQEQIRPVSDPKIDFKSPLEEGQDFSFSIELETEPEINIDKSFKIQLAKSSVELSKEEVDQYMENIRVKSAKYEALKQEKPVDWNDFVEIEINYSKEELKSSKNGLDESAISLLEANKNLFLEMKKNQTDFPLKGLLEGVLGMRQGEQKKIPVVVFSKIDPIKETEPTKEPKEANGQPLDLDVKLMGIKKQVLPSDDEFVKDFKCKDIKELKLLMTRLLERTKKYKVYQTMKEQALKQLVEKNPISLLPEGVIKKQEQNIISSVVKSLKEHGMKEKEIEQYKEKQKKQFQQQAWFEICSSYLIFTLARKLNISVSSQEIKEYLQQNTQGNKTPSDEEYNNIEGFLIREKTLAYLIDTAEPV